MDLLSSSSKEKLAYFRIKDLKDVLTQLGLSKQGKKQDLTDRILSLLSDEQATKLHGGGKRNSIGKETVAKIIDDTYRKMHYTGATDLASKSHINSDFSNVKCMEEDNDTTNKPGLKVRCLCGSSLVTESMIQCEDSRCQIWQHIGCAIVPEKPMEFTQPEIPKQFYCEICRINHADPFWLSQAHPLPPLKLKYSNLAADGTSELATEATFQLTRAERDLLQKSEYDLQIWCILLNDKVPFRMQWPQYAVLQINGIPIRTTNRPGSQLLGVNGRDDGPIITTCSREGINRVCLSKSDARVFCVGIRIAKRRTLQQVLSLIPKEAEGECFNDALSRVRRCVGVGTAADNADSDSDLEVVADSVTVNLRCPMSGSRMKVAGRFKPCVHMGCFDLGTFVELNQRSRKWQCPICLKNYILGNIIIDPYFNRITTLLRDCEEDVDEIEVKPDGCWRVKIEEYGDLGRWHSPDGSLCISSNPEVKPQVKPEPEPEPERLKQFKIEANSNGNTGLKLGIKKNSNGSWEVSKRESMKPSSLGNHVSEKFENQYPRTALMSSSATGSYRDGEDSSINQEGGGYFDLSAVNAHEFDSSLNFGATWNLEGSVPPCSNNANIIVLSDSEEENIALMSPGTTYGTHAADNTAGLPTAAANPMVSEPLIGTTSTSCVDAFGNGNDFMSSIWPLSSCNQTGPAFQFLNAETNTEVQDNLVDIHHNSLGWLPLNGYGLSADIGRGNSLPLEDFTSLNSNYEVNGGLVDNPLAFGGDDPSLQIFLPTQPMSIPAQGNSDAHEDMSNGLQTDDWISLRLGDSGGSRDHSVTTIDFNSGHQFSKEARVESLSDAGALNLGMHNGEGSTNAITDNKRPSGLSRSVKPRLCLSMDMDFD